VAVGQHVQARRQMPDRLCPLPGPVLYFEPIVVAFAPFLSLGDALWSDPKILRVVNGQGPRFTQPYHIPGALHLLLGSHLT